MGVLLAFNMGVDITMGTPGIAFNAMGTEHWVPQAVEGLGTCWDCALCKLTRPLSEPRGSGVGGI